MRLIDAEPIEQALFKQADKSLAKNPYANARVCAFRRAFELVMDAPTIESLPSGAPPNDPLTIEELREMDGEPVWVEAMVSLETEWCIVKYDHQMKRIRFWSADGGWYDSYDYGGRIIAYRHRPEEEPI